MRGSQDGFKKSLDPSTVAAIKGRLDLFSDMILYVKQLSCVAQATERLKFSVGTSGN